MANNVYLSTNITDFRYKSGDKINVQNENISPELLNTYCSAEDLNDIQSKLNELAAGINFYNNIFDNSSFTYDDKNKLLKVKTDNTTIKINSDKGGLYVPLSPSATIIYDNGLRVVPTNFIDNQTIKLKNNKIYVKCANSTIKSNTSGLYVQCDNKTIKTDANTGLYVKCANSTIKSNSNGIYANIDNSYIILSGGVITVNEELRAQPSFLPATTASVTVYVHQKKGNDRTGEPNNQNKPFKTIKAALKKLQGFRCVNTISYVIKLLTNYVHDINVEGYINLNHPDCNVGGSSLYLIRRITKRKNY